MDEIKVREAIEVIKGYRKLDEYMNNTRRLPYCDMAIEALEKQLPKKVDFEEDVAENMCRVNAERNRNFESMKYFQSLMFATERAESIIGDIIRSHMDEVENDGWIPVEERLPDGLNKELYDINLVTLEDGEVCIGVYRDDKKEWWTRKKEGETLYTTKHNVIAWQPLPEPYKPNKDNSATEHIMSRFMKVE